MVLLYICKDPSLLEMHTEVLLSKITFCLFGLFKMLQRKARCWGKGSRWEIGRLIIVVESR